ncbi:MAG: isoaspartyl peptidase/L-asparaginase [Flavipsychrobacter sp.]|nr:isoaspartyl peptidase/L-asparaginase [Flavipsychrobacter sp.]
MEQTFAIAIHGGAGTILRSTMNPDLQLQYEKGLVDAIDAGYNILSQGGSSLEAVEAAIVVLEDCPLYNAGRGAVFNHAGQHEMDASLMNGLTLQAGAVAGVGNIMNPIKLAKSIMCDSPHVLMCGKGAEDFAKTQNIAFADDAYFFTQQRYDQWQEALKTDSVQLDHTERKFGTVGAVALDKQGNIAAGTSTGGMTNKQFGRVGDSPIIGAGTYANNATCGVSCTGHGELFIRAVVAYDISCLMEYKGLSLEEACNLVVYEKLLKIQGEGGLIAIDKNGNIAMPFNSEGMYRAYKKSNGTSAVSIYREA